MRVGTQIVEVYHCTLFSDINVYLVDTPGFDDTNRSDKEVLKELVTWLGSSYKQKIQLNGIIYLHRITDPRMQGSARKTLLMFKRLCGQEALKHVILATTMWERLNDEEIGQKREKELMQTDEFWGWMQKQGSQVLRHYNTRKSAMVLLSRFVTSQEPPITLQIQTEMVDGNRTLDETGAGRELGRALGEEREKCMNALAELQIEMKESLAARDEEAAKMVRESLQELAEKVLELERDHKDLKISLEAMYKDKIGRLANKLEEQQTANGVRHKSMKDELQTLKLGQEQATEQKRLFEERLHQQKQNYQATIREQQLLIEEQIPQRGQQSAAANQGSGSSTVIRPPTSIPPIRRETPVS